MPSSASGRSQAICPASGSLKRRSALALPVSKGPPGPPCGCGGCAPFLLVLVDPALPFVEGVAVVDGFPEDGPAFPPALAELLGVFVLLLPRGLPLNPPPNPPPNPLKRRSIPL